MVINRICKECELGNLVTLACRWTKSLVESEWFPPFFSIFGRGNYCNTTIIYVVYRAQFIRLPFYRSHSTINPNISCTEMKSLYGIEKYCHEAYNFNQILKWLPLRSCTWLYSFLFSSRTLWYPEAAWARLRKCVPGKENGAVTYSFFSQSLSTNIYQQETDHVPRLLTSSLYFICRRFRSAFVDWMVDFNTYLKSKSSC